MALKFAKDRGAFHNFFHLPSFFMKRVRHSEVRVGFSDCPPGWSSLAALLLTKALNRVHNFQILDEIRAASYGLYRKPPDDLTMIPVPRHERQKN